MKLLCACEESQRVCQAFRDRGHEAYSCDILPTSGKHPEWHIQGDVRPLLDRDWDMIIAFPPCTFLTVTGNRWFGTKYGAKAEQRYKDRTEAIDFFMLFAQNKCKKIVIENPLGIMSTQFRKPDQIIHPWMFGDPMEKRTCLWLKGVPLLVHTKEVHPPERIHFSSGKTMAAWYAEAFKLKKEDRAKLRSKAFPGIALAMAEQWG